MPVYSFGEQDGKGDASIKIHFFLKIQLFLRIMVFLKTLLIFLLT